jgi:hypothetical protein
VEIRTMRAAQMSISRLRSGPSGCGFVTGWDDLKLGEERDARFAERIQGRWKETRISLKARIRQRNCGLTE